MGKGAVISSSLFPAKYLNTQGSPVSGPNAFLITIRPGVRPSAALRSLDRIDQVLNGSRDGPVGGVVSVLGPPRSPITPPSGRPRLVLAGVLAIGAFGALGLTLVASVRRRRRELALLRDARSSQVARLAASVAWQSSVSATIGVVIGMPLGIALGRWLWTLFAKEISASPDPTVPAFSMVLIALGALVFAQRRGSRSRPPRRPHEDGDRFAFGVIRVCTMTPWNS